MKLIHHLVPVLRICEALSLWPFHVLVACTVGSELNESFSAYWVTVKKGTYMLAQKSLNVRSNMSNIKCHLTFATVVSVWRTGGNPLNKCFSPSHLTQCKTRRSNSFWWYNQALFYILVTLRGHTFSKWPFDQCQPHSTRNMSEKVLLIVHNQSILIV